MSSMRARRFRRVAVLSAVVIGVCAYAFATTGGASAAGSGIVLPHLKYPVTNFLKYVNGKSGAANPKLSPVLVGWSNNQGGSILVGPTATNGAQAAVTWINKHADGIDGHPIKLVECEIPNTDAEGTTCGDTFAATKGLEAIAFGGVSVGASQIEAVVSPKIPIFIGVSVNPGDLTNPNTYIFGGGSTQITWPYGVAAKTFMHSPKEVSLLFPDEAGYTGPAAAAAQGFRAVGIKPTLVGLDPDATDYVAPLEAADVAKKDVWIDSTPSGCVEIARALAQLNVPPSHVISSPLCLTADVKSALGNYPDWYYSSAQDNLDASRPEVKTYYKLLAQEGLSTSDQDPWFCTAFSEIMSAAQFMNSIAKEEGFAKISPTTVAQAAKVWRGPFILGQPLIKCGEYPNAPASCADQQAFYKYNGSAFSLASATKSNPTGWLQPPPSLRPKTD